MLVVLTSGWTAANLIAPRLGYGALDRPPFAGLEMALSFSALCVAVIVLTTQRRADKLASHREQLTLELAILGEQKTAKVIALLQEIRADNPLLKNRQDDEAAEMARPADPEAVLQAIASAPNPEA